MSNVLAINKASKEQVEKIQQESIEKEFGYFVRNDPEVRELMLARVKEIISEMRNWDVVYHSGFKEQTITLLKSGELDDLLKEKLLLSARSNENNDVNYRIYDALAEHLAGKISLTFGK